MQNFAAEWGRSLWLPARDSPLLVALLQGDNRGAAAQYTKILAHSCPEQLVWRCHSGRALSSLAQKQPESALRDSERALTLAKAQVQASPTVAVGVPAASIALNPDSDPFLSLPLVSLALLHYQRGLAHE